MEKFLPYMSHREIIDLVSYLDRDTEMLEIGGGNSTVFFSRIVKRLVTVEHNLEWSESIKKKMEGSKCNWEIHTIEPNWPQVHPFNPAEEGQFDNYVNFISSLPEDQFDLALIDGRDRVRSFSAAITKVKKRGILLIHDFWNREKYHSLLDINSLELIFDSNSYGTDVDNTLAAFRRIY